MKRWCFVLLVGLSIATAAVLRKREAETAESAESEGSDKKKRSAEELEPEKRKKREVSNREMEEQVSINCRVVIAHGVGPEECALLTLGDLGSSNILEDDHLYGGKLHKDRSLSDVPGRCRVDPNLYRIDPAKSCLCVATRDTCEKGRSGCYWYNNPKTGYQECISKAEKFYNLLYLLLNKRGKKNFAINIRYGATAARGDMPYGPFGPAVIGQGNPNPSTSFGVYKQDYGHDDYYGSARHGQEEWSGGHHGGMGGHGGLRQHGAMRSHGNMGGHGGMGQQDFDGQGFGGHGGMGQQGFGGHGGMGQQGFGGHGGMGQQGFGGHGGMGQQGFGGHGGMGQQGFGGHGGMGGSGGMGGHFGGMGGPGGMF